MIKKRIKLNVRHGALKPGEYTIGGKLADYLLRTGKGTEIKRKEAKVVPVTKEEKHSPEVTKGNNGFKSVPIPLKDYSGIAVKKIDFTDATDEDLLNVIKTDERKTAVKLATEEIGKREGTTIP